MTQKIKSSHQNSLILSLYGHKPGQIFRYLAILDMISLLIIMQPEYRSFFNQYVTMLAGNKTAYFIVIFMIEARTRFDTKS